MQPRPDCATVIKQAVGTTTAGGKDEYVDAKQALEEILDEIAGSPLNVWDDVTDRYDEVDRDFGSKNYVLVQHVDHDTVIKLTAEVVQP